MRYKNIKKQCFSAGNYSIVPIRIEDRFLIMNWRNQQMYHLRQKKILTKDDQDKYFELVISNIYKVDYPDQLLFSYLENNICIGYGGLVHINWIDRNAEISFVMDTTLEKNHFSFHWSTFLNLIDELAFNELGLYKLYTYAYDLRPHLYPVLERSNYNKEAVLKEHCFYNNKYLDVIIHEKRNNK